MANPAARFTAACIALPGKPPTMRHFRSAFKCRNLQMQRRAVSTRALDKGVSIYSSLLRMTCLITKVHERCLDDSGTVLVMVSSAIRQMCCQDRSVFSTALLDSKNRAWDPSRAGMSKTIQSGLPKVSSLGLSRVLEGFLVVYNNDNVRKTFLGAMILR
jgi:hypothetical protein